MESGIPDSRVATASTNIVSTEIEEMAWERTDTRSQPCLIKWWAFKEREWMNSAKSEEPTTPTYLGISQKINLTSRLKRPRSPEVPIENGDILMTGSCLHETQDPGPSDRNPDGNNGLESPHILRPRKRIRLSEPLAQPSLVQEVVDCDGNDDNDGDKENICPIKKRVNKGVVFGDRRKRKPLGIHKPEGYLDIFSKVNAANSSPKQRINTQWKVLDDRVNRTLRHFRGYHREQSDWEYEIY